MKVYLWGERMCDVYPHATKWQVFKFKFMKFMRKVLWTLISLAILFGAVQIGRHYYAIERVTLVEKEVSYPILDKIAKCESGGKQFAANGQVTLNGNTNGSVDIGKYQINNRYWGKTATEMGYNLMIEKDNEAFALWLFQNKGSEVWSASKKCWK